MQKSHGVIFKWCTVRILTIGETDCGNHGDSAGSRWETKLTKVIEQRQSSGGCDIRLYYADITDLAPINGSILLESQAESQASPYIISLNFDTIILRGACPCRRSRELLGNC